MPVYSPTTQRQLTPTTTDQPGRTGTIPTQFRMEPSKGIPRYEDLLGLRPLERSPTVSLPMDVIKDQVTTTPWVIRPTVENPTTVHEEAADEVTEFLDGGFNKNNQKFNHLLKQVVNDILSPDAGVMEKVPADPDGDGNRWLAELYHLDGITMTKDLDQHGVIPEPPAPAYYQFAPRSALARHTWDDVIAKLGEVDALMGYGRRQHEPIPFSRDQIAWIETNPRPETQYGYGFVQKVRRWAEILLNVDISNRKYFSENEIPQGVLTIAAGSQQELNRSRDYFRDTVKGKTNHVVPMFDATPEDISWIPIQGTPEELQFLESQQWYHKLVWFLAGLNQGEIGDFESGNRSMGDYHGRQVFRQTTKPLLDTLEDTFNDEILPAMEAYWRVDGELEFAFEINHEQMQELERKRQSEDLQQGTRTINEIRRERGEEEKPWGDMPKEVITAMARKHPEWAAQHWGGVDEEELPEPGLGSDLNLFGSSTSTTASTASTADDTADAERGTGNARPADREVRDDSDGEIGDEFPSVAQLISTLQGEVARHIETELEAVEETVEEQWPENTDNDRTVLTNVDELVEDVALQDLLADSVVEANTAAMQEAANEETDRLEDALQEHFAVPVEVAEISLDFDLQDTFAWEAMRRRAAQNMVSVEETVREQVRNVLLDVAEDGGNVDDATGALRERVPEISDNHSRLVARTELPQASREGTQALGEATDVVSGKRWLASNDGRSRPWHDEMHDVVVDIDDSWTVPAGWEGEPHYQPANYPRVAHTVGEDQPFNCRCVEQLVLDEDMPDDVRALEDVGGVTVDLQITDRQFEVWREHALAGEGVQDLLDRIDREYSRNTEAPDVLGISKEAYYRWIKEFEVY